MATRAKGLFVLLALVSALGLWGLAQEEGPGGPGKGGPPQFLTLPLLTHVAPAGLDHGHFVFAEGGVTPAPLVRAPGLIPDSPASFGALAVIVGTDLDVSDSSNSYEGETGAATNSTILVGGSNHIYPGNCSASALPGTVGDCAPMSYASSGSPNWTWTLKTLPRDWNGTTLGIGFDPAVDYDKNGVFYYSYGVAPLSGSYPNGIVVVKSADGVSWTKAASVTFNRNKYFDDKYYLAVDRSNGTFANRIYVSWDRNTSTDQILYIAYSTNGGSTWSAPIKVDDGTSKFERVIGAYPAVDQSTGVVYDSWHNYAQNKIFVDKSTNGGVSWGKDVVAATTHAGFGQNIGCVGGRSQGPAHALKVGPSGALYLVYADPATPGRGFDIMFTKSTNSGASWSAPVRVNDDTGKADQFHPTLSVESNGAGVDKITVTFYDRRDDTNNCLANVYATQSTDSGANWSANVILTSAQSNFDGNPNGPGDYSSSTPFAGAVNPFFCDHRASNPQTASGGGFDVYTVPVQ